MLNVDPEDFPTQRELALADALPRPTREQREAVPVTAADFGPVDDADRPF